VVKDGAVLDPDLYTRAVQVGTEVIEDALDAGRAYDHFCRGATIILHDVQLYWAPLTVFCRSIEDFLTHPVHASAYLTPAGARALQAHYDTHDVFVLQAEGSKRWKVHPPLVEQPLPSQLSPLIESPGLEILDVILNSGDSLYIPRGFVHSAESLNEASLHVTIGIAPYTRIGILRQIAVLAEEVEAFRTALPVGFASDGDALGRDVEAFLADFAGWVSGLDPRSLSTSVRERFWLSRSPILEGALEPLLYLHDIDDETPTRKRSGFICEIARRDDTEQLALLLGDRSLRLPLRLEPAVRQILTSDVVRPRDLRQHQLTEEERVALIRRLIREALLEQVQSPT
jgi:hypothetical protein